MNVSEFAKHVGLSAHTIRYYDKIGLLGSVQRLQNGHRIFLEKDVKWVAFIQRLKETGMSIRKIREYALLREQGSETLIARKEILSQHAEKLESKLAAEVNHLNKLKEKIAVYNQAIDGEIDLD